ITRARLVVRRAAPVRATLVPDDRPEGRRSRGRGAVACERASAARRREPGRLAGRVARLEVPSRRAVAGEPSLVSAPIRVLALSPIPEEGAGCRFRIAQFIPHL